MVNIFTLDSFPVIYLFSLIHSSFQRKYCFFFLLLLIWFTFPWRERFNVRFYNETAPKLCESNFYVRKKKVDESYQKYFKSLPIYDTFFRTVLITWEGEKKVEKNHVFAFIVPFRQNVTHFTQFIIIGRLGTIFFRHIYKLKYKNHCLVFLLNINWLEVSCFFSLWIPKINDQMFFLKAIFIMWLFRTLFVDICEKFQLIFLILVSFQAKHFQCIGMHENNCTFCNFFFSTSFKLSHVQCGNSQYFVSWWMCFVSNGNGNKIIRLRHRRRFFYLREHKMQQWRK